MAALHKRKATLEDYFELESTSEFKHQYINGEIFAMAGAKRKHNVIASSTNRYLHDKALAGGCEIYPGDMRLSTPQGIYTYPDVMIVCGKPEISVEKGVETVHNPIVIIEILSPSTENYDRGTKFRHYRSIPSLQTYLLIDQEVPHVEMHTRQSDDSWLLRDTIGLESAIRIESLDATLRLRDIYAQVDFEEQEQSEQ